MLLPKAKALLRDGNKSLYRARRVFHELKAGREFFQGDDFTLPARQEPRRAHVRESAGTQL
jgi:hypothetical protein